MTDLAILVGVADALIAIVVYGVISFIVGCYLVDVLVWRTHERRAARRLAVLQARNPR